MVRTIRICSTALVLVAAGTGHARAPDASPLAAYARARIAIDPRQATANFAAALTAAPDTPQVAERAFRQGVEAGDYALALRAAQALVRIGTVPPEARLLLYIAALRNRDWPGAKARLDDIATRSSLAFLAPVFGDWLALATPVLPAPLARGTPRRGTPFDTETAALILLVRGDIVTGSDALKTLWPFDPDRFHVLRLTAASTLADRGERDAALALLIADDNATRTARMRIAARQKLGMSANDPARGVAFVLARMAGELGNDAPAGTALTIARLAQFADPKNKRIGLIVASALTQAGRHEAALALMDGVRTDPLFAQEAFAIRITSLEALGRSDEALTEATLLAGLEPADMTRLGDIEMRRGRFAEAAARYDAAIALTGDAKTGWALWRTAGIAHDLAGNRPRALAAYERAIGLAPQEPLALNTLGFTLLDDAATAPRGQALIERAIAMQPENAVIVDSLGWAAYRGGRVDEAVTMLERAVSLDRAQPEIGEHLGDAYWAAGRRIEARYAWAAARLQATPTAYARIDAKIARGLP